MEEGRKKLYSGCKEASQVSFIVRLFQIKCMCGISNSAMEKILHLICLVLPEGHCVPNTMDKIRKVVRDLGLSYEKIHACFNDYVLFRGGTRSWTNVQYVRRVGGNIQTLRGLMMWKMVELKRRRFLVKFFGIFHLFPGCKDYI